jgi:ribosomal protein L29
MGKHALEMPRQKDLDQMSNEELQTTLAEARGTYMTDKADTTRGGNPPVGRMRETRRIIARVLTIMQKRGIRPGMLRVGDDPQKIQSGETADPKVATG